MRDSKSLFETASRLIPGGVNSPVRAFRGVGGEPFFVARGEGARLSSRRSSALATGSRSRCAETGRVRVRPAKLPTPRATRWPRPHRAVIAALVSGQRSGRPLCKRSHNDRSALGVVAGWPDLFLVAPTSAQSAPAGARSFSTDASSPSDPPAFFPRAFPIGARRLRSGRFEEG